MRVLAVIFGSFFTILTLVFLGIFAWDRHYTLVTGCQMDLPIVVYQSGFNESMLLDMDEAIAERVAQVASLLLEVEDRRVPDIPAPDDAYAYTMQWILEPPDARLGLAGHAIQGLLGGFYACDPGAPLNFEEYWVGRWHAGTNRLVDAGELSFEEGMRMRQWANLVLAVDRQHRL